MLSVEYLRISDHACLVLIFCYFCNAESFQSWKGIPFVIEYICHPLLHCPPDSHCCPPLFKKYTSGAQFKTFFFRKIAQFKNSAQGTRLHKKPSRACPVLLSPRSCATALPIQCDGKPQVWHTSPTKAHFRPRASLVFSFIFNNYYLIKY